MPLNVLSYIQIRGYMATVPVVPFVVSAAFVANMACGGALPTGEPPFKLDWQASSSEVMVGESFYLTIRMHDVRYTSEHGGISVSFPLLTETRASDGSYSSSSADVEAIDYTTDISNVTFYGPGETIYHRDGNRRFSAQDLLVESDDPSWSPSDDRTLRLRITPKSAGEFPIWIRGWICADGYTDCTRSPADGAATDQQGYGAEVVAVGVGEVN